VVKNVITVDTECAKHTQHVEHALYSGSGGMPSQEKFCKLNFLHEIKFGNTFAGKIMSNR